MPPNRTPLYDEHLRLGAHMMSFAGWEMPERYTGIIAEHRAVRSKAGIFDVSHMGRIWITGKAAQQQLQHLLTNDTALLTPGAAQYTLLCREDGGILDDLVLFRVAHERFLMAVNAATRERDRAWVQTHQDAALGNNIADRTFESAMIALQGPAAQDLLQPLTPLPLDRFPRFSCAEGVVAGVQALVSRTGYTGEDGFELIAAPADGLALWRQLMASGAVPCGLGARDTLRLEAGYVLYGKDIDVTANPIEAGLGKVVDLVEGEFIGREAIQQLMQEGPRRKLVGFEMLGPEVARSDYPVCVSGQVVGKVTSGSYAPTLDKNIGLAYVPAAFAKVGTSLSVQVRGKTAKAVVVRKPFYQGPLTRSKA